MATNIFVYKGTGVSPASLSHVLSSLRRLLRHAYDVQAIDVHTLTTSPWEKTAALLVIPGGRDVPYNQELPIPRIRSYVTGGGRFLGICAGAYFASSFCHFKPEPPRPELDVIATRDLALYSGVAKGPISPFFDYKSESGAVTVKLALPNGLTTLAYSNGGCYFPGPFEPNVEILAAYTSATSPLNHNLIEGISSHVADFVQQHGLTCPSGSAAVISIAFKSSGGQAILAGPHIEYDPNLLPISHSARSLLLSHFQSTNAFFVSILAKLGLHLPAESLDLTISNIPAISKQLYLASKGGFAKASSILRSWSENISLSSETPDTFGRIILTGGPVIPKLRVHALPLSKPDTRSHSVLGQVNHEVENDDKDVIADVVSWTSDPTDNLFQINDFHQELSNSCDIGSYSMHANVISSTQTMLESSFAFLKQLPHGFLFEATQQVSGRGRGQNSWISSPGCLQFSFVALHPLSRADTLPFVQYIAALAMVDAVRSIPGLQNLGLRLKWPNDIYSTSKSGLDDGSNDYLRKVGGTLVSSHLDTNSQCFRVVVGIGINVFNALPTDCIVSCVNRLMSTQGSGNVIGQITKARILARFCTIFNKMYQDSFMDPREDWFPGFHDQYKKRWLHEGQRVKITGKGGWGKISGLTERGFLKVSADGENTNWDTQELEVQPDGNRFDMMEGLIIC